MAGTFIVLYLYCLILAHYKHCFYMAIWTIISPKKGINYNWFNILILFPIYKIAIDFYNNHIILESLAPVIVIHFYYIHIRWNPYTSSIKEKGSIDFFQKKSVFFLTAESQFQIRNWQIT